MLIDAGEMDAAVTGGSEGRGSDECVWLDVRACLSFLFLLRHNLAYKKMSERSDTRVRWGRGEGCACCGYSHLRGGGRGPPARRRLARLRGAVTDTGSARSAMPLPHDRGCIFSRVHDARALA